jgi:hypothetical protein
MKVNKVEVQDQQVVLGIRYLELGNGRSMARTFGAIPIIRLRFRFLIIYVYYSYMLRHAPQTHANR